MGEPPDMDVDFDRDWREEVIQHIYDRYWRDRAAIVATVIRYRTRSAVREVGKALGLSEDVTGLLAKSASSPGAEDTLAEVAAVSGLDKSARRLRMSLDLAWKVHQVLAGMVQPV